MILKVFERLLNIDDIDYKWAVRFMFLFCVVARCAVFYNPYSDTDFTWLNSWMSNFEAADQTQAMDMTLPITSGNIVFLVSAFFALFITFLMGVLYSGLYVRSFRSRNKGKEGSEDMPEPVKMGVIIKRFVLLSLFYLAVSIPFMIISSNLIVFFCIGFPMLFTAPACYLSGDKGMFNSIPHVVRLTRGFYLAHVRSIFLIVLVFFFTDALAGLVSFASMTAFYILSAAFSTWITLTFGRYAGMAYCAMSDKKVISSINIGEKESRFR
ncbi:MAG: hypothetical protein Q3987_02715 [Oscillospiraceae bacterium]|nr:hypothetical protein [Oscillospiraceae bacterium]